MTCIRGAAESARRPPGAVLARTLCGHLAPVPPAPPVDREPEPVRTVPRGQLGFAGPTFGPGTP